MLLSMSPLGRLPQRIAIVVHGPSSLICTHARTHSRTHTCTHLWCFASSSADSPDLVLAFSCLWPFSLTCSAGQAAATSLALCCFPAAHACQAATVRHVPLPFNEYPDSAQKEVPVRALQHPFLQAAHLLLEAQQHVLLLATHRLILHGKLLLGLQETPQPCDVVLQSTPTQAGGMDG